MFSETRRASLLRQRHGHERVTFVELFFDLVFVFAITQLSHSLAGHPTPLGAVQTGVLLLAVWWVWIFTSWVTNWVDPERTPVRFLLLGLMFAGLTLSASVPSAFGDGGLAFALSYTVMQVGRSLFMLWVLRGHSPGNYRNFQRITAWLSATALLWIAGGLAEGPWRLGLWACALAVEYAAPAAGFRTPGLGRSSTTDWDVEGGHMAERCALFIIIALGESILVTGATYAGHERSLEGLLAFAVAFVGSVALWWIYFNKGAEHATQRIADSADPGRMARIAYTYLHVPIVAGIIVGAVGDEMMLAHPHGPASPTAAAVIVGGPALYVLGTALFKWVAYDRILPPLSHLVGLGLMALLYALSAGLSALALGAATTAALVLVAVWETRALKAAV
ncbi:low temperature requirement protein A [Azospirillum doebereinerae]